MTTLAFFLSKCRVDKFLFREAEQSCCSAFLKALCGPRRCGAMLKFQLFLALMTSCGVGRAFIAYPHDATHWTEGLTCVPSAFSGGRVLLVEGIGLRGDSAALLLDPASATGSDPISRVSLPAAMFGEGVAWGKDGRLFQATKDDGTVRRLVLRAASTDGQPALVSEGEAAIPRAAVSLNSIRRWKGAPPAGADDVHALLAPEDEALMWELAEVAKPAQAAPKPTATLATAAVQEAWGLAFDAERGRMLLSDGTATLHAFSGDLAVYESALHVDFSPTVAARCPGAAHSVRLRLNEIEVVSASALRAAGVQAPASSCGEIWAAALGCGHVLRIDACSGNAVGWLDFRRRRRRRRRHSSGMGLAAALRREAHHGDLNGIAVCDNGQVFFTGKRWKTLLKATIREALAAGAPLQ